MWNRERAKPLGRSTVSDPLRSFLIKKLRPLAETSYPLRNTIIFGIQLEFETVICHVKTTTVCSSSNVVLHTEQTILTEVREVLFWEHTIRALLIQLVEPIEVKLRMQLACSFSTSLGIQAHLLHVVQRGVGLVEYCRLSGLLSSPVRTICQLCHCSV